MPKFTDDEQGTAEVIRVGIFGAGLLLAGFAAYHDNPWMTLCAFLLVCRGQSRRVQAGWEELMAAWPSLASLSSS
jgi:hypothetical protein